MRGLIYLIKNPTGKIYVGQTINFTRRMNSYKNGNGKGQPILHRSILKYGYDNHIFSILEECDREFLNEREIYWIDYYKSNTTRYPEFNGMNLTDGGLCLTKTKKSEEKRIKSCKECENSGRFIKGQVPHNKGKSGYKLNTNYEKKSNSAKKFWNEFTPEQKENRINKIKTTRLANRINNCKCETCGKEFHRKPSLIKAHVFCSLHCRDGKK